jgi:glycerophosphoryl diester phosphodiesterase
MKKTITTSFFLFLIIPFAFSQSRVDTLLQKLHHPNDSYVFVIAHRGDWRNAPENSLPAIENAIKMGVDIVELDVQRTRDGHLILMHDATLNRTTTGKGAVAEWTLDSIQTFRLKNGCAIRTKEKVPTLEEALLLMKGRILVNLDKADRYFDEVYVLLEKTGTTQQVIMKGSKPADEVKLQFGDYLNKVIYMPVVNLDKENAEEQINQFLAELKPLAFELLFVEDAHPLPKQMKSQLVGKSLIWYDTLWDTMAGGHDDDLSLENPDAGYGYLIDTLGARMIQTDRPGYLIDYLRNRRLHD